MTHEVVANGDSLWYFWNSLPLDHDAIYTHLNGDTSITSLKSYISGSERSDTLIMFNDVLSLLVKRYGSSEEAFILDSVREHAYPSDPVWIWNRMLTYNWLLGYYGDSDALAGMDSVASMSPDLNDRITALGLLIVADEAGKDLIHRWRNNFDVVEDYYNDHGYDPRLRSVLFKFSFLPEKEEESLDILENLALNEDLHIETRLDYARNISLLDPERSEGILSELYEVTSDPRIRFNIYMAQIMTNRNNYLQISNNALVGESSSSLRSDIVRSLLYSRENPGSYYGINEMRRIKFVLNWYGVESELSIQNEIENYLSTFRPARADSSVGEDQLLGDMGIYIDTLEVYNWIGSPALADTLRLRVSEARGSLNLNDLTSAGAAMASFQHSLEEAYEPTPPAPQEVTREGYRFLWWLAQYVRERLE